MNIIDRMLGRQPKADRQARQRAVVELMRQTESFTRQGLAEWRAAWQAAVNPTNPDRRRLLAIYRDADVDLHLSGCIRQRTSHVLARTFKLSDADGNADTEATELLNATWFKDLMRYALDSIYWGHSLIQLGPLVSTAGRLAYADATLIPRQHVLPQQHVVVRSPGDAPASGTDYTQPPYSPWLIEAGRRDDLGLLLKAASQTIPKKNAMTFWDAFAEMFGMPLRLAKTSSVDPQEHDRLAQALDSLGSQAWAVLQEGADIEVVENSRGDAFNVYSQRIQLADREISKLIIGQTMTIEDGSSLSQSETHLKVFQNLVEADSDFLRDIINSQLLPRMVAHGFPVGGLTFNWNYAEDYTAEQQLQYEQMIADRYEVDPSYFADKYGLPVGAPRAAMPAAMRKADDFFG